MKLFFPLSKVVSLGLFLVILSSVSYGQNKEKNKQIDRFIKEFSSQDLFSGVILVGKNDEVLYQNAFGYANMEWEVENSVDGRFRIGSMTKQFTAALIMILKQEGKVELDDPISKHLSYYRKDTEIKS